MHIALRPDPKLVAFFPAPPWQPLEEHELAPRRRARRPGGSSAASPATSTRPTLITGRMIIGVARLAYLIYR